MDTFNFTIPEETLSWLNTMPRRTSPRNDRGPSRSSTYHEADSKFALTVRHNRRYSLASPPVLPPRIPEQSETSIEEEVEEQQKKASLMDLPNEILDTIVGYAIAPSTLSSATENIITVSRKQSETACTAADIETGAVVHKWDVTNYPSNLFLVNHTLSAIAFHRVWSDMAVNISLTTSDSLCFLKYALSERQRAAMRRVRFPRFMLSWADPVGKDVWLREGARHGRIAPGFVVDEERKRAEEVAVQPSMSRMQSLVGLLQTRSSPVLGPVAS